MKIFREKPDNTQGKLVDLIDKDGITFWFDWYDWLHATKITSNNAKYVLPAKIYDLMQKWEQDMQELKNKKYRIGYPIKLPSLHFIYEDNIYLLTPESFTKPDDERKRRLYFYGNHKVMEEDLKDIGCIYTSYNDFLD